MTGVWMSDSSGFAVTPPRADSDAVSVRPVAPPDADTGAYERTASRDAAGERPSIASEHPAEEQSPTPERERMIARGAPIDPAPSKRDAQPADEPATPQEPRIEQYRER